MTEVMEEGGPGELPLVQGTARKNGTEISLALDGRIKGRERAQMEFGETPRFCSGDATIGLGGQAVQGHLRKDRGTDGSMGTRQARCSCGRP